MYQPEIERISEELYFIAASPVTRRLRTQAELLSQTDVPVLITGEAGSGKSDARGRIGDIFIATDVVNHQEGKETPEGFEAKEKLTSSPTGAEDRRQNAEEYRQKCEALQNTAAETAQGIVTNEIPRPTPNSLGQARNNGQTIRRGRLVSGDSFIASTAKRKWLRETFHADAVDMVSAGIARVCEANGVPYVIIRALSDNADESASAAFAAFAGFVQNFKEPATVPIALALVERLVAGSSVH